MTSSSEDTCSKRFSGRIRGDALPSTDISGGKDDVNGQEKEARRTETPPEMPCSSPSNVMDVARHSFRVGHTGPNGSAKIDESDRNITCPPKDPSSRANLSETAKDKSSDTLISRVRTRASAKPQRYRQATEVKNPTTIPSKPKNKASPTSQRKNSIAEAAIPYPSYPKYQNVKSPGGTWTQNEQQLFENGCILHGWGNWKNIEAMIPTRDRMQCKSHAQKFQKHHPKEKNRLENEHTWRINQHENRAALENNPKGGKKKRKLRHVPATIPETASKSKKKTKPSRFDDPKNHAKAPKRVPATNALKAPLEKTDTANPPILANPHENKVSKPEPKALELDAPTAQITKCSPPSKPKPKPKKNPKALEQDAPRKIAQVTKCAPPLNPKLKKNPKAFDLDAPRKIPKVTKCAPRARKGKAVVDVNDTPGSGTWTDMENLQFEKGCILHGWGNWRVVASCIPSRNSGQLKSHAQKFRKHRPAEKERFEREHKRLVQLAKRGVSADKARGKSKKKKPAAKRLPLLKNRKIIEATGEWSCTEKKQFEDGCIFHGWGNWRDIASHVHTKDMSQVYAHSETYHLKDKDRLEMEHTLNYPEVDENASAEKTIMGAENITNVNHVLLGTQKKVAETPMPSLKAPTPKTTVDDYGAAEAIMGLNFANWDTRKSASESTKEKPCFSLKESPPAILSQAKKAVLKPSDDGDVSADSQHLVDEAMATSKEIDFKETHTSMPSMDEVAAKTAKDSAEKVDSPNYEDKATQARKAVDVESNEGNGLTCQDSNLSARAMNSKGKEDLIVSTAKGSNDEALVGNNAPAKPSIMQNSSQPPPHWLAAGTWVECLDNIHRWNNQLTEGERNSEYLKYNCLCGREKERLRKKLVILMNNRPQTLPPSDQ
eukprot:CAMPEP_0172317988 /NCGR_PEP_ID=MMETSP1058-20130122/33532_1 /TAXON_ID=83371 /ORGANISM="Detonula confervacea, Strain CCMP 353" /LENGTH=887 /DNA_ID=CAMNT_0013032697 /DNA_START=260 /DNA_END=2920 /DNA_ORIENTATION=+